MTETTQGIETDQAAREASGAHAYGRYLEEFEVGAVYKHWPAKTVTEADDHLFCLITMNHHPLHLNDVYARESQQGRNVVVGPLVYSLALGMSVSDVSGKAIANLATEELSHPAPVFHGDTLYAESEVLDVRASESKPDRGVVRVHTRVFKEDGTLVAEFKRAVLVPRKPRQPASRRRATCSTQIVRGLPAVRPLAWPSPTRFIVLVSTSPRWAGEPIQEAIVPPMSAGASSASPAPRRSADRRASPRRAGRCLKSSWEMSQRAKASGRALQVGHGAQRPQALVRARLVELGQHAAFGRREGSPGRPANPEQRKHDHDPGVSQPALPLKAYGVS